VGQLLARLLELHKQNVQLHRLKDKAHGAKVAIRVKDKQVTKLKTQLDEQANQRKVGQSTADRLELEIKSLQEKITKFRGQLNEAKTNKEYQALQNEIKFTAIDKERLEDRELAEMDKLEKGVAEIEEARQAISQGEKELADLQSDCAAELESLEAEIRQAERGRADIARELPSEVLQQFERVAAKHEDDAMCPLLVHGEGTNHTSFSCGGCFMQLTENVYVRFRGNTDDLIACPTCTRILYLED